MLSVLSLQRLGEEEDPSASWIIPSSISSTSIRHSLILIQEAITSPPDLPEGKPAETFLISKAVVTRASARRAAFDDENEDGDLSSSEDDFFPAGGPTTRDPDRADVPAPRRRRLRRAKESDSEGELDAEAEAARLKRAEARRRAETEKRRKIKSDLYVRDSDDEDDEERDREFFQMEEERRLGTARNIAVALGKRKALDEGSKSKKKKRRKTTSDSEGVGSEDDESMGEHSKGFGSLAQDVHAHSPVDSRSSSPILDEPIHIEDDDSTASSAGDDGDEEVGNTKTETPPSSHKSHQLGDRRLVQRNGKTERDSSLKTSSRTDAIIANEGSGSAGDEEAVPVRRQARRGVRAGFVIESDSE